MSPQSTLSLTTLIASIAFLIHGYPQAVAEPTVNMGSNPLVSAAGTSSGVLFSAPSDQLIVVKDVVLTASGSSGYNSCASTVTLSTSTGRTLAKFQVTSDSIANEGSTHAGGGVFHSFESGIPVMVNEEASIAISGSCTVNYVIAGQYTAI